MVSVVVCSKQKKPACRVLVRILHRLSRLILVIRMTFSILLILLFCSAICCAQFTDEQLYKAYLDSDMSVWRTYITTTDWERLDTDERKRLINYEYGFVATAIDEKDPQAEDFLRRFREHVEAEYRNRHIPEAHYYMYMSSVNAYDFMLNKSRLFSSGLESFKLVKKAAKLAPDDPFVLTLKANVDFYAPSAFGGDKEEALVMFLRAAKLFRERTDYHMLWNYASLRMCVAQCYDKAGDRQRAIDECRAILREIPDFAYIRDTYLPSLLAQEDKRR